jgi:hypothetical protein
MSERLLAVLFILMFEFVVLVTLLWWGFDLAAAVAAAGGTGAAAAEIAYRLLGSSNGPGSGGPLQRIRPA